MSNPRVTVVKTYRGSYDDDQCKPNLQNLTNFAVYIGDRIRAVGYYPSRLLSRYRTENTKIEKCTSRPAQNIKNY